jgi:hypothetical protein
MLLQPAPPVRLKVKSTEAVLVYDPALVVAHLRGRVEQHMSASDACAERGEHDAAAQAWDRGARTSALVNALVEQHGLHVPELLELRRETLAKLERLREPLPVDVPASTRTWTCEARGEAIAVLTDRLADIDAELERYDARPAPDEATRRALPAWSGAWSPSGDGSAFPKARSVAGVA